MFFGDVTRQAAIQVCLAFRFNGLPVRYLMFMRKAVNLKSVLVAIAGVAGFLAVVCTLVYVVSGAKTYFSGQASIDKCLDSGGAWDREKMDVSSLSLVRD